MYTCLSRSSSLEGTLIVHAWDEYKVNSGIILSLRREFRHLEILDHITSMREAGTVPVGIVGRNRADLITTYQAVFGLNHVPALVHPALDWQHAPDHELLPPAQSSPWKIAKRSPKRKGSYSGHNENNKRMKHGQPSGNLASASVHETRYSAATVISSELFMPSVAGFLSSPRGKRPHSSYSVQMNDQLEIERHGSVWDAMDWSCAYDAIVTILWNCFEQGNDNWAWLVEHCAVAGTLQASFDDVRRGTLSLDQARNGLRDTLSAQNAAFFPRRGATLTAIDRVIDAVFATTDPHAQRFRFCKMCGYVGSVSTVASPLWSTGFNVAMRTRRSTVSTTELFHNLIGDNSKGNCTRCSARGSLFTATRFAVPPRFLILEVPAEDMRFPMVRIERSLRMRMSEEVRSWRLFGVVYLAHSHFTARFLTSSGELFYHDGIETNTRCVREPINADLAVARGAKACIIMYCQA